MPSALTCPSMLHLRAQHKQHGIVLATNNRPHGRPPSREYHCSCAPCDLATCRKHGASRSKSPRRKRDSLGASLSGMPLTRAQSA